MKRMSLAHGAILALLVAPTAALADPSATTLEQMFPHGQNSDFGWASGGVVSHAAAAPAVNASAAQTKAPESAAQTKTLEDQFHTGQNDAFGAASASSALSASTTPSRIEYFAAGGYTRVVSSVPTAGGNPAPLGQGAAAGAANQLYSPGVGYTPTTPDIYHLRPFNFTSQIGG